jgi:CRISPR-associated protein NE0113 (Cas_NE0113)
VPTEVRIITTRQGAEKAQRTLLLDDPGWFRRLCADCSLPEIDFDAEDIRIIAGPDGKPLDDILDERDNAAVADFITEEVRALTADPNASLHVSIAGGRKTMGLYVGYALSLFGREQDRLSHVLSPSLEAQPHVFYPAPHQDAPVYLGDIPSVRLRYVLPEGMLQGRPVFGGSRGSAEGRTAGALPRSGDAYGNRGRQSFPAQTGAVRFLLDDGAKMRCGKRWRSLERSRCRGGVAWLLSRYRRDFGANRESVPQPH